MVRILSVALCAQAAQAMRMNHAAATLAQPCVNQNLANLAQTNIGQGHLTATRTHEDRVNFTLTQSFDPSTMAIFQTMGMDQVEQPHTVQTLVLNLAAKMLTIKMEKEGQPARCIKAELPAFMTMLPMDVLTKYSNTLRNDMLDCVRNVDGIDVFMASFPPAYVPPQVAQQLPVTWVYTVSAAADGLKKAETMVEKIKTRLETSVEYNVTEFTEVETTVEYHVTYSDGSLEGPSADQLDTSEWGKCQKVKIGTTEADLDRFFKREGTIAVGVLNQYLRAAQSLQQGGLAAAVEAGEAMRRAWGR